MSDAPKPRVIVTTDMEADDMNSVLHLCLYLNELDLEAIVYTASKYHFQGDGVHTLGQVTPNWSTSGRLAYEGHIGYPHPDPDASALTSYRPFPEGWLESLWTHEYAQALPHLLSNAPGYPTPEELLARTYRGNVDFEGDVRAATPGSDVITRAILDDDPRTLWLLSWGGVNTIVRALMTIAGRYQGTPEWERVQAKVYRKVRVLGVMDGKGQDNSWKDHGEPIFPELHLMRTEFMYGHYFSARTEQLDCRHMFQAPWPVENLIRDNGPLMGRMGLYGDGKVYEGEPERFQYGKHATLDFGFDGMEPITFMPFDFMAEGDSMTFIPLLPVGLRGVGPDGTEEPGFETILGRLWRDGGEPPAKRYDWTVDQVPAEGAGMMPAAGANPAERAFQEEYAARAQWCAHDWDECNHAPVISDVAPDVAAAPGQVVELFATATDPDGDALRVCWHYDHLASSYAGTADNLRAFEPAHLRTRAVVPVDARRGDRLVWTLEVQDVADRPLTRYAQVAVTVG